MSETRSVALIGSSNDRCIHGNNAVRPFCDYDAHAFAASLEKATKDRLKAYRLVDSLSWQAISVPQITSAMTCFTLSEKSLVCPTLNLLPDPDSAARVLSFLSCKSLESA